MNYEDLQARIDDGSIWLLEGSAGRFAMSAIHNGFCMLGETSHRDYWGNRVPSRFEVTPGTPGSPEYMEAGATHILGHDQYLDEEN